MKRKKFIYDYLPPKKRYTRQENYVINVVKDVVQDVIDKAIALVTKDISHLTSSQIRDLVDKDTIVDMEYVYHKQMTVRTEEKDKYHSTSENHQKAVGWFSEPPERLKKNGRWFCPHPFHQGDSRFHRWSNNQQKYLPIKYLERSHVAISRKKLLHEVIDENPNESSTHVLSVELSRKHIEKQVLVCFACKHCNSKLDKVKE